MKTCFDCFVCYVFTCLLPHLVVIQNGPKGNQQDHKLSIRFGPPAARGAASIAAESHWKLAPAASWVVFAAGGLTYPKIMGVFRGGMQKIYFNIPCQVIFKAEETLLKCAFSQCFC